MTEQSGDATVKCTPEASALWDGMRRTLNGANAEAGSNTPDFVLANLLMAVLKASDEAIKARDQWYGVDLRPGPRVQTVVTKALVAELERRAATVDPHIKAMIEGGPEKFPTFLHTYSAEELINHILSFDPVEVFGKFPVSFIQRDPSILGAFSTATLEGEILKRGWSLPFVGKPLAGASPADIACELRRQGCVFQINQGGQQIAISFGVKNAEEHNAIVPALGRIFEERARQFRMGYDAAHDDTHEDGSIGRAAALVLGGVVLGWKSFPDNETWECRCATKVSWKHRDDETQRLVIAASLLSAEIDRRLRRQAKHEGSLARNAPDFANAADRMAGHRAAADVLLNDGQLVRSAPELSVVLLRALLEAGVGVFFHANEIVISRDSAMVVERGNLVDANLVMRKALAKMKDSLDITDDLAEIRRQMEAPCPACGRKPGDEPKSTDCGDCSFPDAPLANPGDVVWKDPKDCDIKGDLERVRDQMVAEAGARPVKADCSPTPEVLEEIANQMRQIGGAGMFNGPRAAEVPEEVWQAQTVQAFQMWSGSGAKAPDGMRLECRAKAARGMDTDWSEVCSGDEVEHPSWATSLDWRMVTMPLPVPLPGSIQMPRQNLLHALDTALGVQIATDSERGVDSAAAAGLRAVRNVVGAGGSLELVD